MTRPRGIPVALLIALYALVLAAPLLLALLLRAWGVPRAQVVAERFSYA